MAKQLFNSDVIGLRKVRKISVEFVGQPELTVLYKFEDNNNYKGIGHRTNSIDGLRGIWHLLRGLFPAIGFIQQDCVAPGDLNETAKKIQLSSLVQILIQSLRDVRLLTNAQNLSTTGNLLPSTDLPFITCGARCTLQPVWSI